MAVSVMGEGYQITFMAGEHDRLGSVVEFDWPEHEGAEAIYASEDGTILVRVQGNKAVSILEELPQGKEIQSTVRKIKKTQIVNAFSSRLEDGKVIISGAGGTQPLEYFVEGQLPREDIKPVYLRSGYIHPVRTPSGIMITDDYPEEAHTHHHGIWFPWTKTQFEGRTPDFWNMGNGTGRVENTGLDAHWSGPVHAGLQANHRFVDMSADPEKEVLTEEWKVKFYAVGHGVDSYHLFDLESIQSNISGSPLDLPQYRYGGLGVRGPGEWNGEENCYFLTSNSESDRVKAHTTRANWCHMGGKIDGKWAGIAIFCHPGNFRAPQPMRVHPSEPFFNYAPSQLGDWSIKAGETYASKYRFVVTDGKPNPTLLDRLWIDYSKPVTVTVTAIP